MRDQAHEPISLEHTEHLVLFLILEIGSKFFFVFLLLSRKYKGKKILGLASVLTKEKFPLLLLDILFGFEWMKKKCMHKTIMGSEENCFALTLRSTNYACGSKSRAAANAHLQQRKEWGRR